MIIKLREEAYEQPATEEDVKDMKKELSKWGKVLIAVGILNIIFYFVFPSVIDLIWGIVLVGIGGLIIKIQKRGMYLVLGVVLIFAGITRCISAVVLMGLGYDHMTGPIGQATIASTMFTYFCWFLFLFGVALIVWGTFEIKNFKLYKTAN